MTGAHRRGVARRLLWQRPIWSPRPDCFRTVLSRYMMELAFITRRLRSVCEDENMATDLYGTRVATALHGRLADLRAAGTIADLVAGRPFLTDGAHPTVTLTIVGDLHLVCRVNHATPLREESGAIKWHAVRRLRIDAIREQSDDD